MRCVQVRARNPPSSITRHRLSSAGAKFSGVSTISPSSFSKLCLRQQADILGEHGEEAAHEEFRNLLGVVLSLQVAGDAGQSFGDVAADFGAASGRDRGLAGRTRSRAAGRGWPGRADPCQRDGIAVPVRELGVVLPLTGEVGVDLDHVADIDDQDEGRPAVLLRQRAGVILSLLLGGAHHPVPAPRAAGRCAGLDLRRVLGDQVRLAGIGLLWPRPASQTAWPP